MHKYLASPTVGETIPVRVIESDSCGDCLFAGKNCGEYPCTADEREDGKNVSFVIDSELVHRRLNESLLASASLGDTVELVNGDKVTVRSAKGALLVCKKCYFHNKCGGSISCVSSERNDYESVWFELCN